MEIYEKADQALAEDKTISLQTISNLRTTIHQTKLSHLLDDSDPFEIFQTHSADLCDAIETDPLRIVNRLHAAKLIALKVKKDVTSMSSRDYDKANIIVEGMQSWLEADDDPVEYLKKICDFLQRQTDKALKDIGAKMTILLHNGNN